MPFTDSIKMVDVIIANKTLLSATPTDVAVGKEFIGTTQHLESGVLPELDIHTADIVIGCGESYNIPYGINRLAYNVKAKDLEIQTPGTAGPDNILDGYTAWVNGNKITGNIPDNGAVTSTLSCGEEIQIARGFHNGAGKVTAKSLMDQTKASVVADDILVGSTAWANGELIAGTMTNNKKVTKKLLAGESYTVPKGYHNGEGYVEAETLANQTAGTAIATEMTEGSVAWVNGVSVTGTMPYNTDATVTLPLNGTYTIPNGYHTGLGVVTQNIPTAEGQTIGPTKEAQILELAGYYMNGNITVTGVDALNYQRPNAVVKDSSGNNISNYTLSVSNLSASISLYVDNWHDNSTLNVYHTVFSDLIDENDNSVILDTLLFIDWKDQTTKIYKFNGVILTIELEANTNAHKITVSGIKSGKITMTEIFSARTFG